MSTRLPRRLLIHRVQILRSAHVSDGLGGGTETFVSVAEQVPVRIWTLSHSERNVGGAEEVEQTHAMVLPYSFDGQIKRGHRVIEYARPSRVYDVVDVAEASVRGHHLRVNMQLRQTEEAD